MPFEPNNKEMVYKIKKSITSQSVDLPVNIMSNGVVVKQVLSINVLPSISNVIVTNGNGDVSGGALVRLLVIDADNQYKTIEDTVNFNVHIADCDIIEESKIYVVANLNEVKNIVASESSVSFNIVITVSGYVIKNQSLKYVQDLNSNACQKTIEHTLLDINFSTSQNFDIINEVNLPNSISSVLFTNATAVMEDCHANADILTISGKIFANLVYLTNEETPKLKTQEYILDYTQEILANTVLPEDDVVAQVKLTAINSEVQGELNSSKGVLSLKSTILVNTFTTRKTTIKVVDDVFCPNYELLTENSSYVKQTHCCENFTEKLDGNLTLADDVRIDKILCISNTYSVCSIKNDTEAQINGVVYANVIYQLDDDNLTTGAILAEIPFTKILTNKNIDNVDAVISVKEIEARSKRIKDIDIQVTLSITLNYSQNTNNSIISNVILGKRLENTNKPMGVYIINQADSLWEVAKLLKVSPNIIIEQNPNLLFPITQPTNILVYRQNA